MTNRSSYSACAIALTAAITLLPATVTFAEDAPTVEVNPLTVSAELGALLKTGNVKSADIKAGLKLRYEKEQWLQLLSVDILGKKLESENDEGVKSFDTTDSKWAVAAQSNYTIEADGNNYLYGNLSYAEDRFSSFDLQSSVSLGWGRNWYKTNTVSLFADIGPGYKHDEVSAIDATDTVAAIPKTTQSSLIVQAQALYVNQLNPYVEFRQYLVGKYAPDSDQNSIYKSETSLTTKLIDSLQFKFALTLDYNTKVEETFKNLDTQTGVTLVYSF